MNNITLAIDLWYFLFVKLEIVESSPWVTATLQTDTVAFSISDQMSTKRTIVSFQADENAPALGIGYIKIRASIGKLAGIIDGFVNRDYRIPGSLFYKDNPCWTISIVP